MLAAAAHSPGTPLWRSHITLPLFAKPFSTVPYRSISLRHLRRAFAKAKTTLQRNHHPALLLHRTSQLRRRRHRRPSSRGPRKAKGANGAQIVVHAPALFKI